MMPVGPLMIEHRLIERMIKLIKKEVGAARLQRTISPNFIMTAVDFIRTYADKLHHGKEEDILFRSLAEKPLSPEHKRIMDELVAEHEQGRSTVGRIIETHNLYQQGHKQALQELLENLDYLADFYPKHIEKEDKHFFLPIMNYFNADEQAAMLNEFYLFDRQFIHAKYKEVVAKLQAD